MKKNSSLKVLSVVGASIIPFAIAPLIVSCSKGEDLSNVKMYDKNYRILFNGAGEILDYDGNATELEIPEYLENNSVTSSPYYGKKIQIKKIGHYAFQWDENEDSGRPKLQKVTLPNSITAIGGYAFENNEISSINIPNSITKISVRAFVNNSLTHVTIPDSVIEIGDSAFSYTQLTQVTIPKSVKYLSGFNDTKLTSITIPDSVTEIGYDAFSNTQLTQVTIPDSVTIIGAFAFSNTQLTEVTLPQNCRYYSNSFPINCVVKGGIKIQ